MIHRLLAVSAVAAISLSAVLALPEQPLLPHPHFPKVLECKLQKGLSITIRYQTVTFDKQGASQMKVGQGWHLAGATFETSKDLVVGGQDVKAGKYALSGRKAKDGWQLTLHDGHGFSRVPDDAVVLQTTFDGKAEMFEHLNIDVQPAGNKQNTQLFLDVRFDQLKARALIEIPE